MFNIIKLNLLIKKVKYFNIFRPKNNTVWKHTNNITQIYLPRRETSEVRGYADVEIPVVRVS